MNNRFIQLHVLTAYPPSNLNRDDLGRPKSATVGGVMRLRVSSQSLKRAWRTSETFKTALDGHLGVRTKEMGVKVFGQLKAKGIKEKDAREWAKAIAAVFGKLKSDKKTENDEDLHIEQLAHFSPEEQQAIENLVGELVASPGAPSESQLELLRRPESAVDIALFGRMLAADPGYNVEAAAQVAHAFTVNKASVQDDYFTAVDDLNRGDEDRGAAHIGETGFGSGVYYLYLCINRELLDKNLGAETNAADAEALRNRALAALVEAVCKVSPTGKQNSFASRCWASYVLAEKGNEQPRSLSVAFLKPVGSGQDQDDLMRQAIESIHARRTGMDAMYGVQCADQRVSLDGNYLDALPKDLRGQAGSLADLIAFVQSD